MLTSRFNGHKVNLVETVEELESLRSLVNLSIKVGIDTEDTGLDYDKDYVVGYCVSFGSSYSTEDYQGYYLPIRHNTSVYKNNLPVDKVVDFVQWLLDNCVTWFFNRNYDENMSMKDGLHYSFSTHFNCAQVLAHLVMQEHLPGLKDCCKRYLKWEMIDFESNKAKDHNFGTTDPRVSYIYAAGDPIATVMLARHLWVNFPYIRKIYPLDNMALEAVRRLSESKLYLDKKKVSEEYQKSIMEFQALKHEIYQFCGYEFNIGSAPAKAEALSRFVTLTVKSAKTGRYAMNAEVLDKIDHPLAKMFVKYAEMQTYISSFVGKLNEFPEEFKASYNSVNVPTGRLSSGAQKGNEHFAPINMQNIPKEESFVFVHVDENGKQYLSHDEEGSIGKIKAKTGVRECFRQSEEDRYWVACDYSAQEMCLMANFSGDPNLIEPLLEGKDIHNFIAKKMFGFEDPSHRSKVKILNFAKAYGAGAYTIGKKAGISEEKARELVELYDKTLARLTAWKNSMMAQGRRHGMVFTYFGRPRCVYQWYQSSDTSLHAFADRTCCNSPVQGCVPLSSYVELEDSIVTASSIVAKRSKLQDGRVAVFSHRGSNVPILVRFNTGDFLVCDINHKLVKGSLECPQVERLLAGNNYKVLMPKLRKRHFSILRVLRTSKSKALALILLTLKKDYCIKNDPSVAAAFEKLWLTRTKFKTTHLDRIRTLAAAYGYNVTINENLELRLSKYRRSHAKMVSFLQLEDKEVEVGSFTLFEGYQFYEAQGFYNVNTGGDLIRLDLIKLYKLIDSDEEFRNNVDVACSVHDEIDFYIKKDYLYRGTQKIQQLMEFKPDNFRVPIKTSCAVGVNWGMCADVAEILPNNDVIYLKQ